MAQKAGQSFQTFFSLSLSFLSLEIKIRLALCCPEDGSQAISCDIRFSVESHTYFCKKGEHLVNCIYKQCPTGMQLARGHNQISNNALLKYLL